MAGMKEFQLIRQIQRETAVSFSPDSDHGVRLGIGDDAAVLEIPAGQHLVAATDTLNAGVHFPVDTSAFDIAYKCLAVNLSDLAAMGATPRWALLSLSLPQANAAWIQSFAAGFKSLAQAHGVSLVGGDTTSGPLSVSLTALGYIEPGKQLTRSGAKPGDLIVVSGTLGGAARVLDLLAANKSATEQHLLDRPQPRVSLGQVLKGHANACIDVSDGLLADLGHILKASECGARLEVEDLPYDDSLAGLEDGLRWNYQLSGGDDYELLFTLPPGHRALLATWGQQLGIDLAVIGEIETDGGTRCLRKDGTAFEPRSIGFEHFRQKS
jgi:thiamine-monophosphate kinase